MLEEKALIVNITISAWSGRKFDRKVTKEVNENHNTDSAGNFNKLLINSARLSEITNVDNKIREFHRNNTLPWSDSGDRILPVKNYNNYLEGFTKLLDERRALVQKFVNDYPEMKRERQIELKDLYNERDYPPAHEIAERFDVHSVFLELPKSVSEDFRVELGEEQVKKLRSQINAEIKDRHQSAIQDLFERAGEAVKHIIEALSREGDGKRFHASTINKIEELVNVFPSLNYSGDKRLAQLTEELKSLIIDPANIRKDKDAKEAYLERAKELDKLFF